MDYENRIMVLERQVGVLMNTVGALRNYNSNLSNEVQVLKNIVRLNTKNAESERVSRNNLNKDSMRFTAAAKEGGFRSAAHMNAQLPGLWVGRMVNIFERSSMPRTSWGIR